MHDLRSKNTIETPSGIELEGPPGGPGGLVAETNHRMLGIVIVLGLVLFFVAARAQDASAPAAAEAASVASVEPAETAAAVTAAVTAALVPDPGSITAAPSPTPAGVVAQSTSVKVLALLMMGIGFIVYIGIEVAKKRWPNALDESTIDVITMLIGTILSGASTLRGSDWAEALLMFGSGPLAIFYARVARLKRQVTRKREAEAAAEREALDTTPASTPAPPVPVAGTEGD